MAFNFAKAIADSKATSKTNLLGAIILGASGNGKSSLMATTGLKTLYLYTTGEDHGAKTAQRIAGDLILPVAIDLADGVQLGADEAYERLLSVLASGPELKAMGVQHVVVDGLSELEALVRQTAEWKASCKTAAGKHSTFDEPRATIMMMRPIVTGLKALQRDHGMHFTTSLILDVKEVDADGSISVASPRLQGFAVAETMVQMFEDVLPIGKIERDGVVKYKVQMMSNLSKVSKDEAGRIKKSLNFAPRLGGMQDLPDLLPANLAEIIQIKSNNQTGK